MLLMIRWSPKEITQYQEFISGIFYVYLSLDAALFVDYIFYCF